MKTLPFGTWPSPITPDAIVAETIRLASVTLDAGRLGWLEGRPGEGGRNVLVRTNDAGGSDDVTPAPFNVRSRVHEYGGGAYAVSRGRIWFSNFEDGRIYAQTGTAAPAPLTAEGPARFADLTVDPVRRRLLAVRETHRYGAPPANDLVSISIDDGSVRVLASGHDFFAAPAPESRRTAACVARVGPARHALGCGGVVAGRARPRRRAGGAGPDRGRTGQRGVPARVVARRRPVVRRRPAGVVESAPLARRRAPLHASSRVRIRQAPVAARDDHVRIRRERGRGLHLAKRRRVARGPARPKRRDDRDSLGMDEHRLARRRRLDRGLHRRRTGSKRLGRDARPRLRNDARAPHVERALDRRPHPVTPRRAHLAHGQRRRGLARLLLSAAQCIIPGAGRGIAAAAGHEPRRSDRGNRRHPESRHPVLDEPRLRGARRRLPRQHRIRPRVSRTSLRRVGRSRRRRLRRRRVAPGRDRARRPGAARHPGRQRRRLHHAVRAHVPRRLPGRRELLRYLRPRSARGGHPQVRGPVSRSTGRRVAGGPRGIPRTLAAPPRLAPRDARSSSFRGSTTGWFPRIRPS